MNKKPPTGPTIGIGLQLRLSCCDPWRPPWQLPLRLLRSPADRRIICILISTLSWLHTMS